MHTSGGPQCAISTFNLPAPFTPRVLCLSSACLCRSACVRLCSRAPAPPNRQLLTDRRLPCPSAPRSLQIVAVCVVVPLVLLAAMTAVAVWWWRRRHARLATDQKYGGKDSEAGAGEAGPVSGASAGVGGGSGSAARQPYGVAGQGGCVFMGLEEGQGTEWREEDELELEQEEAGSQVGVWVLCRCLDVCWGGGREWIGRRKGSLSLVAMVGHEVRHQGTGGKRCDRGLKVGAELGSGSGADCWHGRRHFRNRDGDGSAKKAATRYPFRSRTGLAPRCCACICTGASLYIPFEHSAFVISSAKYL